MGATWFWNQHRNLLALVHEFNIPYFKQHTQGISLFEDVVCTTAKKFEISEQKNLRFE
jgi:monoamine oxidase